jgi:outer membrane murein-binding lipoprotein Lpp
MTWPDIANVHSFAYDRRTMATLVRMLTVIVATLGLGGCSQPQAALPADDAATLRTELAELRTKVTTLEEEHAGLKKEVQACRAEVTDALAASAAVEPTADASRSSGSSASRKSSSRSSKSNDVRMPGDG